MPDFSLLGTPDFARAALGGYEAGRKLAQQRRTDAVLAGVDLSRPETIAPVLSIDPQAGRALLAAAREQGDATRETATRAALGNYILARQPKGGDPSAGAPATTDANGDVVVTGAPTTPPVDASEAERALIQADPEAYLKVQENFGRMDENGRKRVAEAAEAQATVGLAAQKLPYEQRRAYIQRQMQYLSAHGVTPDQVEAFDPTDAALEAQVNQALGVKGIFEQRGRERDDDRDDRREARAAMYQARSDSRASAGEARANRAERRSAVRFSERALDRAAVAGSNVRRDVSDLDY